MATTTSGVSIDGNDQCVNNDRDKRSANGGNRLCFRYECGPEDSNVFGFFKKKVTKERRYDVTNIQYELVVMTAGLIKKQTDMFKMANRQHDEVSGAPLLSAGYITPWVIGYCTGLLDAVAQTEANRMTYSNEMQELLFSVVFGDDKILQSMATYIACNEAASPDHGFHAIYELYTGDLKQRLVKFVKVNLLRACSAT